jgi:hypothetical protein
VGAGEIKGPAPNLVRHKIEFSLYCTSPILRKIGGNGGNLAITRQGRNEAITVLGGYREVSSVAPRQLAGEKFYQLNGTAAAVRL